ncbi:sensor histidine kinase [Sphaerisporangium perillae]|uniref:sensor histidine kinase n=1 Tax=Sphaerisporangium perillae TaxID=2935860 RepID=UPI00200FA648|nr:sensor histidine kinase [Sphaerisporangium perillae]
MRRLSFVAGTLAATSAGLVAIGLVLRFQVPLPERIRPGVMTGDDVVGVVYPALGLLLVLRRPRLLVAWLMLTGGFATATLGLSQAFWERSYLAGDLRTASLIGDYNATVGALCIIAVDLLLPLLFPDGRLPSRRWRPVAGFAVGIVAFLAFLYLVRPSVPGSPAGPNPFEIAALAPVGDWLGRLGADWYLIAEGLCVLSLVDRFRTADPAGRRQVGWLLYAVAANWAVEHWMPFSVPAMLTTAAIPAAIGIAVTRYRLYGIDTLASRTLIAAGLVGAVGVVYFAVSTLGLVAAGLGQLAGLAAALFAGAAFQPLRRGLRRVIDLMFYGQSGDPRRFADRLTTEVHSAEPVSALAAVVATVRDALAVSGVAVEVIGGRPGRVATGLVGPSPREVRLVWHGEPVGRLLIGRPGPRRFPLAHDERMIAVLTPFVADVAHAVRMAADLQRSRERILTAREEERRRLRRDLHDGLGQALGDMAMAITMARRVLRGSPESAEQLLARLRADMDRVTGEIRELVYGLRPPALDDLGLAEALRRLAEPDATLTVEGALDGLPAAVEVAAYRITQEALTNARRHARASRVVVGLSRSPGALRLSVRDDGRGLPPKVRAGVGLSSMRERAAELGGTCSITAVPAGGTLVEVSLPLRPAEGKPDGTTGPDGPADPLFGSSAPSTGHNPLGGGRPGSAPAIEKGA